MMDIETIDNLHDKGLMPTRYWVQQNGKSAEYNWEYQRRKFIEEIEMQRKIEELKKRLQDELLFATLNSIEDGAAALEQDAAQNIVNNIAAAFDGGIHPERLKNHSFSKQLAAGLGRALADAPFKLLDDFFKDEYGSRR